MSLFGVIMLFVTMGWTLILVLVIGATGDIFAFLRSSHLLTFIIGYIVIMLVYVISKKIVASM